MTYKPRHYRLEWGSCKVPAWTRLVWTEIKKGIDAMIEEGNAMPETMKITLLEQEYIATLDDELMDIVSIAHPSEPDKPLECIDGLLELLSDHYEEEIYDILHDEDGEPTWAEHCRAEAVRLRRI